MHRVSSHIDLPLSREEAWDFFSQPQNLLRISPPKMSMRLQEEPPRPMYPGMIIRFKVSPLLGISLPWVSEISQVLEGHYFIDTMLQGPFQRWHHQHHFESIEGGCRVKDIVHYQMPFGPLGELFHPLLVKKQVAEIFDFREQSLKKIFPH